MALLAAMTAGTPAHAGTTQLMKVSARMTCTAAFVGKFEKGTVSNDGIIATILNVTALQAKAYDLALTASDGEIVVVQRCDGTPVRALAAAVCASSATTMGDKYAEVCRGAASDWLGPLLTDGMVSCRLSGKLAGSTVASTSGQCKGTIQVNTSSCDLTARVAGKFKPSGSCF